MGADRERDLDAEVRGTLAGEPTPKLEDPDNLSIGDGTACFLDVDRMCNSECRAYDNAHPDQESPDVCVLLRSVKDFGVQLKNLVGVGSLMKKMNQDRARATPDKQTPPDPTGRGRKPT